MASTSEGKITAALVIAILAAALGSSLQFGLALGSLNTPETFIRQWINETHNERYGTYYDSSSLALFWALVISLFGVGAAVGGVFTSFISAKFGRRNGLLLNNITIIIGAIVMALAKLTKIYELLVVGRIFVGFNAGLNSGLAPMYLNEIAPTNIRGAVGTIFQLFVTIGILVGQVLGLEQLLGGNRWWLLVAFPLIPSALQLILLPMSPKSPKYLYIERNDRASADRALRRLRGRDANVNKELQELEIEAEARRREAQVSMKELVSNHFLRSVLVIAVMMMVCQQLSGINVAIFYSSSIFKKAGLSDSSSMAATIGMGAVNVAMTFVSMIIVDRAGRRALLLIGYAGMLVMTLVLTFSTLYSHVASWVAYMAIVGVILFVVSFATGPGSIPWFLVTELFTSNARSRATTCAVVANWVCTTIIGFSFPLLINITQQYTFLIFTGLLALFIVYVWYYVPETRGKTTDEIQQELQRRYGTPTTAVKHTPSPTQLRTINGEDGKYTNGVSDNNNATKVRNV